MPDHVFTVEDVRRDSWFPVVAELKTKVRARDNPRSYHGGRIRDRMLVREATKALACAEREPLKDTNHLIAVELLSRLMVEP